MKKAIIGVILFLVIGCGSQKDPIEKYVKEDIVLEVGSKININNVIDVAKVDNEELKKSIEKATVEINYKDNEKIEGEIGKDKIFATNNVQVKYDYEDKEYEKDIEVKIKDTKKPEVTLKKTYYFNLIGNKINKEDFVKELDIKVKDNGKYTIDISGYDDIDFNKVKENKLKIIVKDEADNNVKKDIYLFVGKEAVTYDYKLVRNDVKPGLVDFKLVLPSGITSYYDITVGKLKKYSDMDKGTFKQTITLKNASGKIKIDMSSGFPRGWPNVPESYNIGIFEIIGNNTIVMRNGKGWMITDVTSDTISQSEITRVINLIAGSSYEY